MRRGIGALGLDRGEHAGRAAADHDDFLGRLLVGHGNCAPCSGAQRREHVLDVLVGAGNHEHHGVGAQLRQHFRQRLVA